MKKIITLLVTLIIIAAIIILAVTIANKKPKVATATDTFAQCIADSGTTFYGAFWCPHCNEQKVMFSKSAKLLPYQECSQANRKQNSLCTEKQIESYPTWVFPDGIKITQEADPIVCEKNPGIPDENAICTPQTRSDYGKNWFFNGARIMSTEEPTREGSTWIFPPSAQMRGTASFEQIAEQTGCALPIEEVSPEPETVIEE